jgi:hypothetical protein
MIKQTDNAVFILGAVRLCVPSIWGIHFTELKDNTSSSILSRNALQAQSALSPYLIGSTLAGDGSGSSGLGSSGLGSLGSSFMENGPLQKINIENLFKISFIIPNLNEGEALNNVLMPTLKNMRTVIDVPSQFIWNGFYMAMGFLKNYTVTFKPSINCYEYTLLFKELLYSFKSLLTELTPYDSARVSYAGESFF